MSSNFLHFILQEILSFLSHLMGKNFYLEKMKLGLIIYVVGSGGRETEIYVFRYLCDLGRIFLFAAIG